MSTTKPISPAQRSKIESLIHYKLFGGDIPETSWEASCIIRNAPASKRDKDQLANTGGKVLARMTSGELEMTEVVVKALAMIDAAGVKNEEVLAAASYLRKQFTKNKQQ